MVTLGKVITTSACRLWRTIGLSTLLLRSLSMQISGTINDK